MSTEIADEIVERCSMDGFDVPLVLEDFVEGPRLLPLQPLATLPIPRHPAPHCGLESSQAPSGAARSASYDDSRPSSVSLHILRGLKTM